ncbi:MAG: glycosyltransferase family 39 protein, partial [Anaerolineae bacterium]|nr:glycosyltransferase family 39 protein [Anaerolineae bacterium]
MSRIQRRILFAILAAYTLLGVTYSIITPLFEASDELWHYPMVKYLADNSLQLPPQDPANPGPWRQEGSQPPLYYMLAAVLTAGIDTSDMESVRRINPHADIGIVRPDGNANMMVHRAEAEAFPWRGTVLAAQITRLFSVALGLGTVLVTFWLGREIFPEWTLVALGAAALNAFLPMFLFISGSVNNDNLSNLLGNLLTLQIVRLLKSQPHWRQYVGIGIVAGAGLLAKLNIGFLIPLVALALLIVSWRRRDWRPLVIGGVVSGTLTIAIAGWWYWHNYQLYGDPSGINRFLEMVGRRAIPANAAQLWSERHSFTQAYWGFFGGVNVALPEIVYLIFNIIGGAALVSAVIFIGKTAVRREWPLEHWLPAAVTILWPIITFVSFLRWTAETPASQGRLVFGALSSISLWMAVGLAWWLPTRLRPALLTVSAG